MRFMCCRKKKCACSSCYCSNCSQAFCYKLWPSCYCTWPCCCCWNCSRPFCYCWNCSQKGLSCDTSNMYAPYSSTLLTMSKVRPISTFLSTSLSFFFMTFLWSTYFTNSMRSMFLCLIINVMQLR